MIQPETIREIHRICQEWESRPPFVAPRPRRMRWLPTWVALLVAAGVLFAGGWAPSIPLPGWWKIGFILVVLAFEIICLIYLLASMVVDAIPVAKELKESSSAFPPAEDRELEPYLDVLRGLAGFGDQDLLFVARSLETRSRRIENWRAALFGIGSLVAAVCLFLVAHPTVLDPIVPGFDWIPKVWGIVRIGVLILAGAVVVGFVAGLGSIWLESSANANRALLLRRVVEDRTSLTVDG